MPKRFDPMTSEPERVLREIAKVRKAVGLTSTQREIAEAVGVTQPCVCGWAKGLGMGKASRKRIADALTSWRAMDAAISSGAA